MVWTKDAAAAADEPLAARSTHGVCGGAVSACTAKNGGSVKYHAASALELAVPVGDERDHVVATDRYKKGFLIVPSMRKLISECQFSAARRARTRLK